MATGGWCMIQPSHPPRNGGRKAAATSWTMGWNGPRFTPLPGRRPGGRPGGTPRLELRRGLRLRRPPV
eukprot:6490989-Lingulodinium_polyedra.AAC.1